MYICLSYMSRSDFEVFFYFYFLDFLKKMYLSERERESMGACVSGRCGWGEGGR